MSVQDVILFVSSTSSACSPVIQFVHQNQIPVKTVRLDNTEDRNNAANGKYFQIVNVPSLLVMYNDENIQMFVGQEKIIMWFQQIIQKNMAQQQLPNIGQGQQPLPQQPLPQHKSKSSKKKPVFASSSEESSSEESSEEEYEPPVKKKSSKKKKGNPPGISSKKKRIRKKKPLKFEGESEEEIEFFDEKQQETPPQQYSELGVGPGYLDKRTAPMGSIYEMAKQMEAARQESLGYKEEDLPTSGL